MSIMNYVWDEIPKDLIFPVNDIVTFVIEKLIDNEDQKKPQMILECRVVMSTKMEDYIGEKVMFYFPFTTKNNTSNKMTFRFLMLFFGEEMTQRQRIPYENLPGHMFSAVSTINVYEGKESQRWDKFAAMGKADTTEF